MERTSEGADDYGDEFRLQPSDSLWSYPMLAQAHEANGQIEKTIADYHKALELHPDDDWAGQQIPSLLNAQ